MRRIVLGLVVALALPLLGTQAFAGPAKVTITAARKVALDRVPGAIDHVKIKTTKHHTYYNIKIIPKGSTDKDKLKKVVVDAETGLIVKIKEVKRKGPDE